MATAIDSAESCVARRHVSLLTSGEENVTGGHLYNRRIAGEALRHGVHVETIRIGSHFDLGQIRGQVVVDSLVASAISGEPVDGDSQLIGLVHQVAGGVTGDATSRRAQRVADLAFYRRCDLIIAASMFLGEDLVAAGIPEQKITIVPPGRDLPGDSSAPPDLRAGRKLAVLNVANWLPNKGILELLEAIDRVSSYEAVLHLVGSSDLDLPYAEAIRLRLEEPGLREKVVTHGVLSQGHLRRLYAGADVLALTSLNEGYGTVVAEALGVGVPVIAWQSGNIPNLFDHGKEGLQIPAGDIDGVANGIRILARDEGLLSMLSSNAAVRGATLPTWEQAGTLFFSALNELNQTRSIRPSPGVQRG